MDTFIVRVTSRSGPGRELDPQRRERQLASALGRVQTALPSFGIPFQCRTGSLELPEQGLRVSWGLLTPEGPASSTLSWAHTERCAALVVGEVFSPGNSAQSVARAFELGGARAVAELDGCFGAVTIDLRAGQVWVASDLLGRLALRLAERDGEWFISPHDACLVAAGAVAIDFDPIALVSSAVLENSLSSKSLVRGIVGLEGNDIFRIDGSGTSARTRLPKLDFRGRLDPKDREGIRSARSYAVERCVEAARHLLASAPSIRAALTAGLDSRAALAILMGAGVRSSIRTVTSGGAHSLDFRTARLLASLAGVPHSPTGNPPATASAFIDNGRLWAFVMNGDTDAKRAARPLPRWGRDEGVSVEGTAGEVYRGYYYQYFGLTGTIPDDPRRVAHVMLTRRYRRFRRVPLASESFRSGLADRLRDVLDEYTAASPIGSNIVDLFYVFERCAHWGARAFRSCWTRTVNPFLVPSALRAAYRLPAPIGRNSAFHAQAIRRYFPQAYWIPVNGGSLLALEGPGRARYATRQLFAAFGYGKERLRRRFDKTALTTDHSLADLFATELHEPIRSHLLRAGSVVESVFSRSGVEATLREHAAKKNQLALLGYWMSHALFEQLLSELAPRNAEQGP